MGLRLYKTNKNANNLDYLKTEEKIILGLVIV